MAALEANAAEIGRGPGDRFTAMSMTTLQGGAGRSSAWTTMRYARTYRGLPVLGGEVVVSLRPDRTTQLVSSYLHRAITMGTAPKLTAAAASRRARERVPGAGRTTSAPRLVVDAYHAEPRLAWEVVVAGHRRAGIPSRVHLTVDALTGATITRYDEVKAAGTGDSFFHGTVRMNTAPGESGFELRDEDRRFKVGDDNNRQDPAAPFGDLFLDEDNRWGDGSQDDRATAGVDAFFVGQKTADYLTEVLGRPGLPCGQDDTPLSAHLGEDVFDAFWTGCQGGAHFGDGGAQTRNKPMVAFDVVAHEIGHGVAEPTLGNATLQSAGLHEATGDVLGSSVECWVNEQTPMPKDPCDYRVGSGLGFVIRAMNKPSSVDGHPDCFSDKIDQLQDEHEVAGVGNHFYYLLAFGTSPGDDLPDSPTCNDTRLTGIGRDEATKIWFGAIDLAQGEETYASFRGKTLAAAERLYGRASVQYEAVQAAWAAVNVDSGDDRGAGNPDGPGGSDQPGGSREPGGSDHPDYPGDAGADD
ncbi:M4 family metallopeptidase [Actinoplanes sp. NPDC049681]|uniref:M4 family metallopeptidase n=1 Tax=Actinoplanes sp. NPDC049681 TaxID=3363905 RepID=UPI0037B7E00A